MVDTRNRTENIQNKYSDKFWYLATKLGIDILFNNISSITENTGNRASCEDILVDEDDKT